MREFDWVLPLLRGSLQLLAEPVEDQIRWLSANRVHHDELALDLNDVSMLVPQLEAERYLTREHVGAVTAVDEQLEAMSGRGNAPLWTDEALRKTVEWGLVRGPAAAALSLLADDGVEE
jgi:hypothetical protein